MGSEMNSSLMMLLSPNTDHVAKTSSRCIYDFDSLKATMMSRNSITGSIDCGDWEGPDRLSQFSLSEDSHDHGDEQKKVAEVAVRETPEAAKEITVAAKETSEADVTSRSGPALEPRLEAKHNIVVFNAALHRWTATVEDQMSELNRSFEVLRKVSNIVPEVLDNMESGLTKKSRWRSVMHDDVALLSLQSFPAV